MEAATLVLLASGMGIMFGWQPMSDGSPRYEYVVQLEPELVATLEEGQSIPISSDIPDDIQPIGRIRIVVGRQPLPRQQLTTRLKPVPTPATGKKIRTGVIETQYTVPPVQPRGGGRYGSTTSQSILPPSGAPSRLAQAPQNISPPVGNEASQILPPQSPRDIAGSVQDATHALGNQIRNIGQSVRTDTEQLFGASGNPNTDGPLGRVGDAVGRVQQDLRQGFQQGMQPLREAGEQLQNTVEGLGQRTRELVDQFGRPLRDRSILGTGPNTQQTPPAGQAILSPNGATPQGQTATQRNPQRRRLDQPVGSSQRDDWTAIPPDHDHATHQNNTLPQTQGSDLPPTLGQPRTRSNPDSFNTPWPPLPHGENQTQAADQNSSSLLPPSGNGQGGGRYSAEDSRTNNPRFPVSESNQSGNPRYSQQSSGDGVANSNWPAPAAATPEIRRDMLDQPANAELQTTGGQPVSSVASSTPPPGYQQPTTSRPQATDFSWDTNSRAPTKPTQTSDDGNNSLFPLLLSWVLLSGSGAGNLYLFWSYLDVRQKYRGIVHSARSSDGRHSRLD